jgi:hypothetical protein
VPRTVVPVIVDIPDDKVEAFAEDTGIPANGPGGRIRTKDVVDKVWQHVEADVTAGALSRYAVVSIKR